MVPKAIRLSAVMAGLITTTTNSFSSIKDRYQSISPGDIKLDLVGLIAVIPSSTASKLSTSCPPRSTIPPPCYMGVGMNSYLQDSEKMPQWRSDAYLITNGYQFYVENARTNAWLSMVPESGPGILCEIEVSPPVKKRWNTYSLLSYLLPITAVLPGAVLGGTAGIIVAAALITGGISGMLFAYEKEKYEWVGPTDDNTFNRLLVLAPDDKWYLMTGRNMDIKSVTAGTAVASGTWKTFVLQWIFKASIITVAIAAANAVFMAQVGLIAAYVFSTTICEIIIYNNINSIIICERECKCVKKQRFKSKQNMLDYVEKKVSHNSDMQGWRQHFKLTVPPRNITL
jgi:hypothetical protein